MSAPHGNSNAVKNGKGVQVNLSFYLDAETTEAIKRKLRQQGVEPDEKAVRKYAREQSKNGIWAAIRDELPPIIL